jgi:hypothetical protein
MTSPPQNSEQKLDGSGMTRAKTAAIWLCLVAVATILNSLILFKYSRFIDLLIGLSFTQFIDAIFVGMQLEPPGAPWWYTAGPAFMLDMPFVLALLVLAVKVSHRRYRAAQVSFWLYAIDTLVITVSFTASIAVFHTPVRPLAWQSLTLIVHAVGLLILSRARRASVAAQIPA